MSAVAATWAPGYGDVVENEPARRDRRAWVEQIMGMPISVHVRGAGARGPDAAAAVGRVFADLRAADAMFSTYKDDSQISQLGRGELTLADADPAVREVHRLCRAARTRTDGYVDAWATPDRPGQFDPTVLVKTWAVARAARHLDPLPHLTTAIGAGGDILIHPNTTTGRDTAPHTWLIGIEDPTDPTHTLATVTLADGGIATSGSAARGAHIVNPHTGLAATGILSATVIGPSLLWADVFATAAIAHGTDAPTWVHTLHGTSGLLVLDDHTTHRWHNEV